MKFSFGLSLLLAANLWGAEPSMVARKALVAAQGEWKTAVLKADKGALDKLLSPDLTYTHSSAKTQTKEEFLQDVTGGTTSYQSIEFQDTKFRVYGGTAVITHTALFTTKQTGTSHLYITEVWAENAGQWQMVSRQATKIP